LYFGVTKAAWTPDAQFFLFSMQSSGGHQPWHWPLYVYSVRTNRLYYLDDYIGSITSEFVLLRGRRLRTTRINLETKDDHEPVVFRLAILLRSRRGARYDRLRSLASRETLLAHTDRSDAAYLGGNALDRR